MSDTVILASRAGGVLTLTLNRPEKLNAFNAQMVDALLAQFATAQADDGVRAIVLSGAGRGFSAGQDLAEVLASDAPHESIAQRLRFGYNALVTRIREIEKPVIASLNGIAAGVGLSLALACDLRVAADDCVLTLGFSKIGLIPDGGASLFLPLLAGFGRGLELAWSSDRIDASEAYRLGLINRIVPAAELTARTAEYAGRFAEGSPVATGLTKRAFNDAMLPRLAASLEREAQLQEQAATGADFAEGVAAFVQKRKAAFAVR